MALAALPIITPVGPYPTGQPAANSLDFVFTAADATSNTFVATGRELLLIQNTDSGAHTFTVTSVPDDKGRSQDITTYSLSAGEFGAFVFSAMPGWKQTNGTVIVAASDVTVKFAVIRLPSLI